MKNILNRFWPIFFIIFVWFIFSSPFIIFHKIPYPSDYQVNHNSPWNTYPNFWGPVKNPAMPDIPGQIFPWRHFNIGEFKNLNVPLWNPYYFSGNVSLANYQSAPLQPFNILFFILDFNSAWAVLILVQPLLAGIFFYYFVRIIKLSKPASIISSISFMFCGFMTVWMEYGTLDFAILYLPFSLFSIEKYYETKSIRYLTLLSLVVPFSFFSGHFQISIYFLIFTLLYLLFKSLVHKNNKTTIKVLFFLIFGILLSMPQLLPSFESYLNSVRSSIFQKIDAIPFNQIATIVSPDFFGNPVIRNGSTHYAEWAMFSGSISFFISLLALFQIKKNKYILFFILTSLLSLMLSLDTPISDLYVNLHIPALSTSALSRIIIIFSFSISVLSAFGFDQLIQEVKNKNHKTIIKWMILVLSILTLMLCYSVSNFMPRQLSSVAIKSMIVPVLIISLLFGSVIISLRKNIVFLIPLLIIILTSLEMLRFSNRWIPFEESKNIFPNLQLTKFLYTTKPFRVISPFGQDPYIYFNFLSVEGYDPIYIERYGKFISFISNGNITNPPRLGITFPYNGKYSKEALNILGIKYVVTKTGDENKPWSFPIKNYPKNQFKVVWEDPKYRVYENTSVKNRIILTSNFEVENSNNSLQKTFIDYPKIILEKNPGISQGNNYGKSTITSYSPEIIKIRTETKSDSVLFLSDNYYPGWTAKIDGKKTEILKANYTFRAVVVTKGDHNVEFDYEPDTFKYGVLISIIGTLGLILSVIKFRKVGK